VKRLLRPALGAAILLALAASPGLANHSVVTPQKSKSRPLFE
jgi:hypothetical protein